MKTAGFSLVEVLVAILVLGVALIGLSEGVVVALQSNKDSELQATAALFAVGRIETIRAEGDITEGEADGDCGAGLDNYRWKQSVARTTLEGLHSVTVVVENAKTGKPIYELQTMLFEAPDETSAQQTGGRRDSARTERRRGR